MKDTVALTADEVEFACKQMRQWLEICEANNRKIEPADVDHSSLLRRLLAGKSALLQPPPKRFGYPAWELIESDEIEVQDIQENNCDIIIDQHNGYSWVDKENKIIKYDRLNLLFQIIEKSMVPDPSFIAEGSDPEDYKYHATFLKKISHP